MHYGSSRNRDSWGVGEKKTEKITMERGLGEAKDLKAEASKSSVGRRSERGGVRVMEDEEFLTAKRMTPRWRGSQGTPNG